MATKWRQLSDEALAGEIARLAADVLQESMSVMLNRALLTYHLGELEQRLSRRLRSAADDTAIKEEATP